MRFYLVGPLFLLILSATALAQVTGEVETIGFQNSYRPYCWTPMIIRLTPQTGDSADYIVRVHQEDLDKDQVIYSRRITVTGNPPGAAPKDQRFWVYFLPQPTGGGLPDPTDPAALDRLQDLLHVDVCTTSGRMITRLPITATISSLDPPVASFGSRRDRRLILVVTDPSTGSQAQWLQYQSAYGLLEDIDMIQVRVGELPDDLIGLQAVDAILWLNADPATGAPAEDKVPIIRQYVRNGGQLVICQMDQWAKTLAFGDLLPVTFPKYGNSVPPLQGMADRHDLQPLRQWIESRERPGDLPRHRDWDRPTGPFKVAVAQARPGAIVEDWIQWPSSVPVPGAYSPYLVRSVYGLGAVTWVAQDLGAPTITALARTGWPFIWDHVFGWRNDTQFAYDGAQRQRLDEQYPSARSIDIGAALNGGMRFAARSASYVLLALVFFIGYWIVAGPGSYFYLLSRKRAGLSWFMFGASAAAATALTVLLVQLVLRGPPQVKHVSLLRQAPAQPALVRSRIGLYIPRDGAQRVALSDLAPGAPAYICPLPVHPQRLSSQSDFSGALQYTVAWHDPQADAPAVAFPYRSTLKKIQVQWAGDLGTQIVGTPRYTGGAGLIEGTLTNASAYALRNIYLAFTVPIGNRSDDYILYLPAWNKGQMIDLGAELRSRRMLSDRLRPEDLAAGQSLYGRIVQEWTPYWYRTLHASSGALDDLEASIPRSLPLLTFFSSLPPDRPDERTAPRDRERVDLLRMEARDLDLSPAIAAGGLAILAQADGPLPMPLDVEGDRVGGEGMVILQTVIPLDRGVAQPPATQPTSEPAAPPPGGFRSTTTPTR